MSRSGGRGVNLHFDASGKRLSSREFSDVAVLLLERLARQLLRAGGDAGGYVLEELPRRMVEKGSSDMRTAAPHTSAVMAVSGEAMKKEELGDVREQMPQELYHLLEWA